MLAVLLPIHLLLVLVVAISLTLLSLMKRKKRIEMKLMPSLVVVVVAVHSLLALVSLLFFPLSNVCVLLTLVGPSGSGEPEDQYNASTTLLGPLVAPSMPFLMKVMNQRKRMTMKMMKHMPWILQLLTLLQWLLEKELRNHALAWVLVLLVMVNFKFLVCHLSWWRHIEMIITICYFVTCAGGWDILNSQFYLVNKITKHTAVKAKEN